MVVVVSVTVADSVAVSVMEVVVDVVVDSVWVASPEIVRVSEKVTVICAAVLSVVV